MLSKVEIEFYSSLEKMFNYLKNKKELTEFEKLVIINFDYITKKVLSPECKTATEIVSKNMYYELIKRKEEYYEKKIDQLESDNYELNNRINDYIEERQKLIEKKDTIINTMKAEFERLENLEDNTDMLKEELKKKDKIIDEAISWIKSLHDSLIEEYGDYETEFSIKGDNVEENEIKEYIISEVEKEYKDDN